MRVVFMGSPDFAVPSLRRVAETHEVVLVVAQPDKPAGRGRAVQAPPVKRVALELGLPVAQPARLRPPARETISGGPMADEPASFLARVQALAPDVLVVVAYGKILPRALLDVARLGPYNVHASLLPKYRGAAPIQRAIMHGDSETGVCVMRILEQLDAGPVLSLRRTPIGNHETSGDLFGRLSEMGAALLSETLPDIAAGRSIETPQRDDEATLAPPLRKEDGRLDFSLAARLVAARARAVDPWPGAFALLSGEPIKLFRVRVAAGGGPAGAILAAGKGAIGGELEVACGEGAVAFAEVQFAGRRRMTVREAMAGRPVPVGTRLE